MTIFDDSTDLLVFANMNKTIVFFCGENSTQKMKELLSFFNFFFPTRNQTSIFYIKDPRFVNIFCISSFIIHSVQLSFLPKYFLGSKSIKILKDNHLLMSYSLFTFAEGARYFDEGVFSNGDGLDTPLGHPLLDKETVSDFGINFPSAQDVSDKIFNINNTDSGNNGKVPHLFMTFGQFMDHDFAYVTHPSSSSSGCESRYLPISIGK